MSHDHGKRNNKEQIPQRKLGTVLRSFFNHVTSHDEEGVHAALCMVANAAPAEPGAPEQSNGVPVVPMHICNFGAGDPIIVTNSSGGTYSRHDGSNDWQN